MRVSRAPTASPIRPRRRRAPRHAGPGRERAVPAAAAGGAWSACTPRSRAATTRSRPPPALAARPRRRRAHPRGRGLEVDAARAPGSRGLARDDWLLVHCVHLDRRAARHDRPQPAVEHEQRRRLRPPGRLDRTRWCSAPTASAPTCSRSSAWPTPGCARTTCRPTPDTAWRGSTNGWALVPRGAQRPGDVELRPRRRAVAPGVHPRRAGARRRAGRRRGAAARRPADARRCRPRCGPRPPSRPSACSPEL